MDLQIDALTLALTTVVTASVGWAIKALLDQLKAYMDSSRLWRNRLDKKIDALTDATQTNMRAQLVHLYEKYVTRGWMTPEERAAWYDMHDKYSALDANGLIDTYRTKLADLPDKEV